MRNTWIVLMLLLVSVPAPAISGEAIRSTVALVAAVRDGAEGATIEIAAGTFELEAPLEPKSGMTLKGAGMDKTVLTHTAAWKPSTKTLPDPEMTTKGMDTQAYLIRLKDKAANVTISDLTLRGPQLHGAIYGWDNQDLHLHHLRVQDTLWSGIRTFLMKNAKIHDCEFIDAGGRWDRGMPGVKGGITSSDLATKGLGVKRARVQGQIVPGVPVWELGPETKFPGLPYVVFPGNVGGPEALHNAVQKLKT